jgi:cation:H+ antiporter
VLHAAPASTSTDQDRDKEKMLAAWLLFLACAGVTAFAGYRLVRYGDIIAEKTGLSATWIGLMLVASVTSLPELSTGLASVTVAHVPDIAVGDVLGSCVFNLALIALLDFLHREAPLYRKASTGHILAGGFSVILIGLVVFGLLSGDAAAFRVGQVGISTPAIVVIYLVAVRAAFVQEKRLTAGGVLDLRYPDITLRHAIIRYGVAAIVVVGAGIAMPFAAEDLARAMGWSQSFVGTLLVAAATSLPEAAATIGAVRLGAIDLAIGNLFGSNLFNILVIAIDDVAYLKGPLLTNVSQAHALSGVSAMIMTGAAIVGLHYRPETRLFKTAGWISLALVLTYVLNSLVLYLRGL